MKEISINEILVNIFKKYVGKYLYNEEDWAGKKECNFFLIKEVKILKGRARIKLAHYDKFGKYQGTSQPDIKNLKDKWKLFDKNEFTKMCVLQGLK